MDLTRCPLCRAWTWTGSEDTNRAALPYRLDPARLTSPAAELAAVGRGRLTWTRHWNGSVYLRRPATIAARPAGHTPRQDVHADHGCEKGNP